MEKHQTQRAKRGTQMCTDRGQSVCVLVPWRRARKDCLDKNSYNVHVSKCACPGGKSTRRSPDEHAAADNDGRDIMDDSVGQPRKQIKNRMLVRRKDVAQVCAVEYVFERGQNADPNGWSIVAGNVSVRSMSANVHGGTKLGGGLVLAWGARRSASSQARDCGADRSDVLAT
jgi:hypothetical protein